MGFATRWLWRCWAPVCTLGLEILTAFIKAASRSECAPSPAVFVSLFCILHSCRDGGTFSNPDCDWMMSSGFDPASQVPGRRRSLRWWDDCFFVGQGHAGNIRKSLFIFWNRCQNCWTALPEPAIEVNHRLRLGDCSSCVKRCAVQKICLPCPSVSVAIFNVHCRMNQLHLNTWTERSRKAWLVINGT